MKRVVIRKPGDYRQLVIEEHPDPLPAPDEVLIEVQAAGVNFADCITRMGLYSSARHYQGYPITPGFEAAGIVRSTGSHVTHIQPEMPVLAISRFNAQATHLIVPGNQVFPLPATLTPVQAAALPAAALTAWFALFELAHVQTGNTLLVHSAAGGVGSMLVQMGKRAGCRVIAVVGASHKVEHAQQLGADVVIDKSQQDLWFEVKRIAPQGYDVVLDANGITTLKHSYAHLAPVGKLVVYGFHSMLSTRKGKPGKLGLLWDYLRTPRFSPFDLTTRNRSVLGFNLSYLFDKNEVLQRGMKEILEWVESGDIHLPTITRYKLEAVADAHRDLETGQTTGKLVLVTGEYPGNAHIPGSGGNG